MVLVYKCCVVVFVSEVNCTAVMAKFCGAGLMLHFLFVSEVNCTAVMSKFHGAGFFLVFFGGGFQK